MIRVNLLGTREPTGAAPEIPGAPSADRKGVLVAILFLGGALGLTIFQYLSAKQAISQLDQEINDLNQEKARLAAIIQRVNEFQKKLEELEKREELIEQLKRDREGPVHMLDDLSIQLPDFVWLTSLNQQAQNVTINGMAASYVSIADYIQKLEASEYFSNVELIDAKQDNNEFTSFQLRTQLVTPQAPQPAAAAGPAGSR